MNCACDNSHHRIEVNQREEEEKKYKRNESNNSKNYNRIGGYWSRTLSNTNETYSK